MKVLGEKIILILKQSKWIIIVVLFTSIAALLLYREIIISSSSYFEIEQVICTKAGSIFIFYHKFTTSGDVVLYDGSYVETAQITSDGKISKMNNAYFLSGANMDLTRLRIHEIQENYDIVRLIGMSGEDLFEIWWFKGNNSIILEHKISHEYIQLFSTDSPKQCLISDVIRNYEVKEFYSNQSSYILSSLNSKNLKMENMSISELDIRFDTAISNIFENKSQSFYVMDLKYVDTYYNSTKNCTKDN